MCYNLSTFELVRLNCEMFRETDDSVNQAWENPNMRMPLYGFDPNSVIDVNLRRLFTSNILNYMYINIQLLLDMFLTDTSLSNFTYKDGVYLTKRSERSRRRFLILKKFRIYDGVTCRGTNFYMKVSAHVHEYPGPWIVAVTLDLCEFVDGKELLVESLNRKTSTSLISSLSTSRSTSLCTSRSPSRRFGRFFNMR